MNKKRKWIRWISLFVFIMAAAVGTKTMCYAKDIYDKNFVQTKQKNNQETQKKQKVYGQDQTVLHHTVLSGQTF